MKVSPLRPSAEELLEAAREHIATKVVPTLKDPQLRYQTLVAAHVLGVVERELSGGREAMKYVAEQRRALPGAPESDAALCELIRAGSFDDDAPAGELRAHLAARTELALMAWNPLFVMRVRG